MTSSSGQNLDKPINIRKLYREILFWVGVPIFYGIFIILFDGEFDILFLVSTLGCLTIALYGVWTIYQAKKRQPSGKD